MGKSDCKNRIQSKWNKAVYTLEKNGHFDMTFEWDQTLQDEWDNAMEKHGKKVERCSF